jgi:tryptophan-rich sensory protein
MNLLLNILIFYAILIGVNIPAPFLGLEFDQETQPRFWFAPPGWVIPVVWFLLFTLLGLARTKLQQIGATEVTELQGWLIVLAILCATYAYYTLGLAKLTGISALWFGLFGNLLVIGLAILIFLKLFSLSFIVACLVAPVGIWTSFATLIILAEMRQQSIL